MRPCADVANTRLCHTGRRRLSNHAVRDGLDSKWSGAKTENQTTTIAFQSAEQSFESHEYPRFTRTRTLYVLAHRARIGQKGVVDVRFRNSGV